MISDGLTAVRQKCRVGEYELVLIADAGLFMYKNGKAWIRQSTAIPVEIFEQLRDNNFSEIL